MTGPDVYKQFENDTASITTTSVGGDTITLRNFTFRKRDVLLGGIALIALVMVLILAIVLAVEVSKNSDSSSAASASASAQFGSGVCTTVECLKAGHMAKEYMDPTVDPCEDFYTYACGGYAAAHPQTPRLVDVDATTEIAILNAERMSHLLGAPVEKNTEHSYERKMKHYMSACSNHFDKMDLRGRPFVEYVINKTPGWYLFGEFSESEFDLHKMIRTVHVDYWTAAFFDISYSFEFKDWTKSIIEFMYGGLTLFYPTDYIDHGLGNVIMPLYRSYIRHLADLLSYDRNSTSVDKNRVEIFVGDVIEIETALATAILDRNQYLNPYFNETTMTLGQVNKDLNGTIDLVDYLQYLFNETSSQKFNQDTKVAIRQEKFFVALGAYLNELLATSGGKRKIHNYLMWQLMNRFADELSWDYVFAKRKLLHITAGVKDASEGSLMCLYDMDAGMPDAMSAIFIKHYTKEGTRSEGVRVLDKIKEELLRDLDKFNWMAGSDREEAKTKIKESIYKVGYSDLMANETQMDSLYDSVQISDDDHFKNVLSMIRLKRKRFNDLMGPTEVRAKWHDLIWSPVIEYYNPWHTMTVTYAMLQNPLFSANGPAYYNYGGIGSLMAEHLMHAVDRIGSQMKLDRTNMGNWWSNSTMNNWQALEKCAVDMVKHLTIGPYRLPENNRPTTINSTTIYYYYAPILLSEATGIRISYNAYLRDRRMESLPYVFPDQSAEKLFFLSYAQTNCRNTPDSIKYGQLMELNLRGKERVNAALTQIPEFAKAFQCPSKSKLASKQNCVLFE